MVLINVSATEPYLYHFSDSEATAFLPSRAEMDLGRQEDELEPDGFGNLEPPSSSVIGRFYLVAYELTIDGVLVLLQQLRYLRSCRQANTFLCFAMSGSIISFDHILLNCMQHQLR